MRAKRRRLGPVKVDSGSSAFKDDRVLPMAMLSPGRWAGWTQGELRLRNTRGFVHGRRGPVHHDGATGTQEDICNDANPRSVAYADRPVLGITKFMLFVAIGSVLTSRGFRRRRSATIGLLTSARQSRLSSAPRYRAVGPTDSLGRGAKFF